MYASQLIAERREYMRRARNARYYRDVAPLRHFWQWQGEMRACVAAARLANRYAVARLREYRAAH